MNGSLPELLLQLRARKGLRLADVSRSTGLSVMTISNFERSRTGARRTTRLRIEQFLRKQGALRRAA